MMNILDPNTDIKRSAEKDLRKKQYHLEPSLLTLFWSRPISSEGQPSP